MPDTAEAPEENTTNELHSTGDRPAVHLAKSAELPTRSDMLQLPAFKKSSMVYAVTGALTIVGLLTGGTSYLGNAQGEAETQAMVSTAVNQAILQMELKVDERSHKMERKFDKAIGDQNRKLDAINTDMGDVKLDIRDIKRDIRDMSK